MGQTEVTGYDYKRKCPLDLSILQLENGKSKIVMPWDSIQYLGVPSPLDRALHMTCLCHVISEENVFLSFLCIKRFELGVEVAFHNTSAVNTQLISLKYPRWGSYKPMILLYCLFAFSRFPETSRPCLSTV